jgi:hypothetical protein
MVLQVGRCCSLLVATLGFDYFGGFGCCRFDFGHFDSFGGWGRLEGVIRWRES